METVQTGDREVDSEVRAMLRNKRAGMVYIRRLHHGGLLRLAARNEPRLFVLLIRRIRVHFVELDHVIIRGLRCDDRLMRMITALLLVKLMTEMFRILLRLLRI